MSDPEHHTGFFIDVWTTQPLSEDKLAVLETAIWHICHDNLEPEGEQGPLLVEVHPVPVLRDGPNPWEGAL